MTKFIQMNSIDSDTLLHDQGDLSTVYQGILNEDIHLLQKCLQQGLNVNWCFRGDSDLQHIGMTPLALAAALNKLEALEFFLRNGANINDTFASLRTTALMTSAFHGHVKVVEMLLRYGANVQAIDLQGSTALGYAFGGSRSLEVIETLISSGININQKNMLGMNALLLVAGYGDNHLVDMVLASRADPNTVNDFGHSALHLVIVGKRSQLKKLVQDSLTVTLDNFNSLKSAEVAIKDWAAKHRNLHTDSKKLEKAASLMSNIGTKVQKTFIKSFEDNEQEVIKQRVEAMWLYRQEKLLANKKLLKKSGKLESLLGCRGKKRDDHDGAKPYLAVPTRTSKKMNNNKDKEINELKDNFASILTMIAKAGCDVALTEKTFGLTALDMAILLEDVESTGHLIALGADPEHLLKMFALSDLHESITSGDRRLVEKLIAYDTDLDLNHNFSAFNVELKNPENEEMSSMIVSEGMTPLCVAVQMPEDDGVALKIAKILIKNKASIDREGPAGSFPLAEAARAGNLRMCQLLCKHGAEIEKMSACHNNATPFLIAALFNRTEVAQFFYDRHAMMDHETSDGKCALTEAYRNDNMRLIEIVMRGSLASAFKDRLSFTYEMVAKYQRPDKNMNLIMKLIGHQVKKIEKIHSGVKPKIPEETVSKHEKQKTGSKAHIARSAEKKEVQKKTNIPKTSEFLLYAEEVAEKRIVKNVSKTLQDPSTEIEKVTKDGSSKARRSVRNELKPFLTRMTSEVDREGGTFLSKGKAYVQDEKATIESRLDEEKVCTESIDEEFASLREGSIGEQTEVTKKIVRSAESPIKSLIHRAERASELRKKERSDMRSNSSSENENNNSNDLFSSTNRSPQKSNRYIDDMEAPNYSGSGSRVEDENDKEEWEDDRGFKEHYYPVSGYNSKQEPCMMTTPILGRCSQVRSNYAQAECYLKDVISAGKSKKPKVFSAIRSIEPEDSGEEDGEVQVGNVRISADFRSLPYTNKQQHQHS